MVKKIEIGQLWRHFQGWRSGDSGNLMPFWWEEQLKSFSDVKSDFP